MPAFKSCPICSALSQDMPAHLQYHAERGEHPPNPEAD